MHSSQNTRLNDLSYGIKIWTDVSSVLSQITRLTDGQTDRQTDRQTDGRTDQCSAVIKRQCRVWGGKDCRNALFLADLNVLIVTQSSTV